MSVLSMINRFEFTARKNTFLVVYITLLLVNVVHVCKKGSFLFV